MLICAASLSLVSAAGAEGSPPVQKTSALEGTVQKIDAAAHTVIVKTMDGTERTFSVTRETLVHGVAMGAKAGRATIADLKSGSRVIVHYTSEGATAAVREIDRIGGDGLHVVEGSVKSVDRAGKRITIAAADGTEQTFELTDRAAHEAGADLARDAKHSERVTIYYTDAAGRRVAHFFKKAS